MRNRRTRKHLVSMPQLRDIQRVRKQLNREYADLTLPQLLAVCRLFDALETRKARDPLYVARRLVTNTHLSYMHRWSWALKHTGLKPEILSAALKEGGMPS